MTSPNKSTTLGAGHCDVTKYCDVTKHQDIVTSPNIYTTLGAGQGGGERESFYLHASRALQRLFSEPVINQDQADSPGKFCDVIMHKSRTLCVRLSSGP